MADRETKPTGRAGLIWLAQGVVTVALIGWVVIRIDAATIAAIRSTSAIAFGAAVTVYSLSQIWCAARLRLLIAYSGPLPAMPRMVYLVRLTLATFFVSNFLPGTIGGDVVKAIALTRNAVPLRRTVSVLLIDRLTNVAAALLLCIATIGIAAPDLLVRVHVSRPVMNALAWLLAGGVAGLVILGLFSNLFAYTLRALRDIALDWLKTPLPIAVAVLFSAASLMSVVAAQWILASGLAIPVTLPQLTAVICLVYIVTLVPITFNGIGLQEASIVVLLMQFGTQQSSAVTFALLTRLLVLALSLVGGAVFAVDRQLLADLRTDAATRPTGRFMQLFHESRLKRLFVFLGVALENRVRR